MSIRPTTLEEFIGQEGFKKKIKVSIDAARERGDPLPHVLLSGGKSGGVGKTTLAEIVANEYGVEIKTYNGASIQSSADLAEIFTKVDKGDIVHIDEIHALDSKRTQETLYTVLEDFNLTIKKKNVISIPVEPFCLIGSTTEAGKLTQPFKSRFPIKWEMVDYTNEQLDQMVKLYANKFEIQIPQKHIRREISLVSKRIPRAIKNHVSLLRDWCQTSGSDTVTDRVFQDFKEAEGFDEACLGKTERSYLSCLHNNFGLNPAGINNIASVLGQDKDTLEKEVEPWLIANGLLEKTKSGRQLTQKGFMYVQKQD